MNYTKIAGQFVCKMAMPLALMFAACSTEDGNAVSKVDGTPGTEMGGASDEPRIVAYEKISLSARAYYAPAGNEAGSSEDVSVSVPTNVFFDGGQIILTELDTVTLEPLDDSTITESFKGDVIDSLTGERVPGDDGMASFDSVSLRSPIVLLEAVSGEVSLSAIVDIRDANTFVIDGLSHLATYRIRKLAESGMSFVAAKAQAETEVANALGFGSQNPFVEESLMNSSNVAVWRKAFNEVVPFDLLQRLKEETGETGAATGVSDGTKKSLMKRVESSYIFTVLQVSPRAFESLGDSAALYYQECLQKRAYFASLLASVFGFGSCSSKNEGTLADISSDMYELKCESSAWNLTFRKANQVNVNHTFGTMTDSRDGKTYKTVQLNLDDVSQTWMAENLNYETEGSSCFQEHLDAVGTRYCSAYGRVYSFVSALDSSYRKYNSKEECVAVKTIDYMTEAESEDTLYWTNEVQAECDELFDEGDYRKDSYSVNWERVIDSLDALNFDVCPEGWRMPRYEDWATLFQYLRNQFDVEPGKETNLLLSGYGNPTGFSMDFATQIRGDSEWYRIGVKNIPYLFSPVVLSEDSRDPAYNFSTAGGVYGTIVFAITSKKYNLNSYYDLEHAYGLPEFGFVRCIKND